MQTSSGINDYSKATKITRKKLAESELPWNLYNNPCYYDCVARAAKYGEASGHWGRSCASNPAADQLELEKFDAKRNSHDRSTKSAASIRLHRVDLVSCECSAAMIGGLCKNQNEWIPTEHSRRPSKTCHKPIHKSAERSHLEGDFDMVDTLQGELQKVWVQVQELEEACICARMEINKLHLGSEGKVKSWPSNLYTKLAATVLSFKEAAARERQPQQQQLQIHIKKLEKQLAEAKKALAKAKKDIIKERKARQLLELICAKLASEIGQGNMELDDLKQESMLINHQVEAKHRILPMSEARQEEKLQVKLTEAEFQIAHKNLSIDAVEQEVKDFFHAAATRRRI